MGKGKGKKGKKQKAVGSGQKAVTAKKKRAVAKKAKKATTVKKPRERRSKDQLVKALSAATREGAKATRERDAAVVALADEQVDRDEREKALLPWLNFAGRVEAEWCKSECPGRRVTTFFIGDGKQEVSMLTTEEQWLALLG